jgi:AraC-like DNA-binding protein
MEGVLAVALTSSRYFPRHSHEEFGIGVLATGAQRSWSGKGMVESLPGDVITVNADEVHDGLPKDNCTRQWRMLYIHPAIIAAVTDDPELQQFEFQSPSASDKRSRLLFERAYSAASDASTALAFEQALIELLVGSPLPTKRQAAAATTTIRHVRDALDSNPTTMWTLSDLAKLAALSRFQLVRSFARETGLTPHAYLVQRRVRLARSLISKGERLVEAALLSGFADQSHMTRAFLRQYGYTPGAFAAQR